LLLLPMLLLLVSCSTHGLPPCRVTWEQLPTPVKLWHGRVLLKRQGNRPHLQDLSGGIPAVAARLASRKQGCFTVPWPRLQGRVLAGEGIISMQRYSMST
jgi:hypothetical protein